MVERTWFSLGTREGGTSRNKDGKRKHYILTGKCSLFLKHSRIGVLNKIQECMEG